MKKAIYIIENKINNKIYVGQSNNPTYRWKQHLQRTRNNEDKGKSAIHDAMRKLGIENFTFTILGWFEDYNEKEKEYIKFYNSLVPYGYNLTEGGDEPPHFFGEEHPNSVYSQKIVDEIIEALLSKQFTQAQICKKWKVPQQLVTSINRGATHRKKGIEYPIIKTSNYHCDEKVFEDICYLLKNSTCTCSEIGQYFGFSSSTIKAINSGRNHYSEEINYPIRTFRGKANSQSVEAILAKRSTETIDTSLEMQVCTESV